MALSTTTERSQCNTYDGCGHAICTRHANEHRQILGKQIDDIIVERDQLCQSINEQIADVSYSSSMKEISQWEQQSINNIHRIADHAREKLREYTIGKNQYIRTAVQQLAERINKARIEDDFIESDLKRWSDEINRLKNDISLHIPVSYKSMDDDLIVFFPKLKHNSNINDLLDQTLEDDAHLRVIKLSKTGERLGLSLKGGREIKSPIYISQIVPNSVAWKQNELLIGDQLLSINGVSVENKFCKQAVEIVKQAEESVTFVVRYSPQWKTDMKTKRTQKTNEPINQ